MIQLKLPIVIVVALASAVAGGAVSYIAIPNTDPEMEAFLKRQVELAESEARERKEAGDRAKDFFSSLETPPTSGGQKMAPRF